MFYYNPASFTKDFSEYKDDEDALQKEVLKYVEDTFRKAEKELVAIEKEEGESDDDLYLMIYDLRYPTKV